MEKLTIKEIGGYLPYKLKINTKYGIDVPEKGHIYTVIGVSYKLNPFEGKGLVFEIEEKTNKEYPQSYFQFKPILYPLEMLTKTIVHNGVEIILFNEMKKKFYNVEFNDFIEFDPFSINISLDSNSGIYWGLTFEEINGIIQMFYEYHFDIHGLIPRGLAIDKSTLNSK